jgi:hypothetical protein
VGEATLRRPPGPVAEAEAVFIAVGTPSRRGGAIVYQVPRAFTRRLLGSAGTEQPDVKIRLIAVGIAMMSWGITLQAKCRSDATACCISFGRLGLLCR